MNPFYALTAVLASAAAAPSGPVTIQKVGYGPSTLQRAPAHDSASIESHRLGGNFAYATAEAHAYASVTPEISEATHPVAETTHVHQPAPIHTVQPAPIVKTTHVADPVFGQQAVYAQQPVIGPVAKHTTVHQPIFKKQHVTVHQPTATVVSPAKVAVAAPAVATGYLAGAPAVAGGYLAGAPAVAGGYLAGAPAVAGGYLAGAPALAGGYLAGAPAVAAPGYLA